MVGRHSDLGFDLLRPLSLQAPALAPAGMGLGSEVAGVHIPFYSSRYSLGLVSFFVHIAANWSGLVLRCHRWRRRLRVKSKSSFRAINFVDADAGILLH